MKVLRIRKCLIVGTRSVRRASGLLETGFSVTCPAHLRQPEELTENATLQASTEIAPG
jgi:hypothetical protein